MSSFSNCPAPQPVAFDTAQAANYTNVPKRSLENYRYRGGGPVFCKLSGIVRYLKSDLDAWLAENRQTSTSSARGGV